MENTTLTPELIRPHNAAYDPMDKILRMIMGDYASVSNSWPGNYGKPCRKNVEIAQQKKYEEYFKNLGLKEHAGMKIYEIGPGWGPFSNYCLERGVAVTSVCPGEKQFNYLKKAGYDVHRSIWQEFTPENGPFDAIVVMGCPEHFVTPKEYLDGKQDLVYRRFFDYAYKLLKPNGRIGGQFMTFNGKQVDYSKLNVIKEGTSDQEKMNYHIGLLTYRYPDSWIPRDFNHFFSCAKEGDYKIINVVNGREHYIWTMKCWTTQFYKIRPVMKWFKVVSLVINGFFNKDFGYWAKAFWLQSNRMCFEKGWMGHEFFFVEKQ